MRETLEAQRQRGLRFPLAWQRGLEKMRWPEEKGARDEWKRTLEEGKPIWEAAYTRTGEMPRGLSQLTTFFDVEESEHFPTELVA
jgi:hypothetical protein